MKALVCVLAACGGIGSPEALDQPIHVQGGQFIEGPLPGLAPDDTVSGEPLAITIVDSASSLVQLGTAVKRLGGRTTTDAYAVGVALAGEGIGYWVEPVGAPDPTAGNELTFSFDLQIGWDLPLGATAFDLVAFDDAGVAGRQRAVRACIVPRISGDDTACDANASPPDTVIALTWDTDVDLDLVVRGDTSGSVLDHDANANCASDGLRREDRVWAAPPASGTYLVYAHFASACAASVVHFRATIYRSDGHQLVEQQHVDGTLLAGQAPSDTFLLQLPI